MDNLRNATMEEKKQMIQLHMQMLKDILRATNMIIAFDKTNDNMMFIDRDVYLKEQKAEGFQIPFKELSC